jgi:hypothetical protein
MRVKSRVLYSLQLIVVVLLFSGCTSSFYGQATTQGYQVDYSRVLGYKYDVVPKGSAESLKSGALVLQVKNAPIYGMNEIKRSDEYTFESASKTRWMIAGIGVGAFGIVGLAGNSSEAAGLGCGLLGSAALVTLLVSTRWEDGSPQPTHKYIDSLMPAEQTTQSERFQDYTAGQEFPLSISAKGSSKVYRVSSDGFVSIDLQDFGPMEFTNPNEMLSLDLKSVEPPIEKRLSVPISVFAKPYVRVEEAGTEVINEENNKVIKLGTAKKGDVYPVVDYTSRLIKIRYHNQDGYLEEKSCTLFWTIN